MNSSEKAGSGILDRLNFPDKTACQAVEQCTYISYYSKLHQGTPPLSIFLNIYFNCCTARFLFLTVCVCLTAAPWKKVGRWKWIRSSGNWTI